nr:MAG TPA: hypothetical protein [Caudoviricetes sp.]
MQPIYRYGIFNEYRGNYLSYLGNLPNQSLAIAAFLLYKNNFK